MITCQLCDKEIGNWINGGLVVSDKGASIMGDTDQIMPYPAYHNWPTRWQHVSCWEKGGRPSQLE